MYEYTYINYRVTWVIAIVYLTKNNKLKNNVLNLKIHVHLLYGYISNCNYSHIETDHKIPQ